MSKFIGRRTTIGVAKEASRGVPVDPTYWIPFTTISFDEKVEKVMSEESFGNIQQDSSHFITNIYGEGDMEAEFYDNALGLFLLALLGQSTPALVESGVYDHTITIANNNQHPSLAILAQDPIQPKMFPLSMLDSFKVTVEPDGIVKYGVGFVSRGARDWSTKTTDFTANVNKFLHQHLQIKVAENLAGLAGATPISVKSFELEIAKNVMRDNVVGTVQSEDILNQQLTVTGTIKLNHEDNTFKNYDLNNTYRAMEIKFVNPATIGASSNPTLTIQLPRVSFTEWERDRSLNDIVTQQLSFVAQYDSVNADNVIDSCVLRNTVASY